MTTSKKFKRNFLRRQFEEFSKEFTERKRMQKARLAQGESLKEGEILLTHKPPFGQFIKRMEYAKEVNKIQLLAAAQQKIEEEKKLDLEWKEE